MAADEVIVRRALRTDVPQVRALLHKGGSGDEQEWTRRFGDLNLSYIIETSFLSVVALNSDESQVIAFAALDDAPSAPAAAKAVNPVTWERWLQASFDLGSESGLDGWGVHNTLWLSVLLAAPQQGEAALTQTLQTVVTTLPQLRHLLFTMPTHIPLYSPMTTFFRRLPTTDEKHARGLACYTCSRQEILPDLIIRRGMVEDFDDLMPLLLAGDGVLTAPPEEFYLDETLENQDADHAVLVAEDPHTRVIVGLMCMSSSVEEQAHVIKHYSTDAWSKLKPVQLGDDHPSRSSGQNTFSIDFFYLNPDFENRAGCFVEPAFAEFPSADYCYIQLPHSTPEHALLHGFSYVPLKPQTPNPSGVWLLCRHSLAPLGVRFQAPPDEAAVGRLVTHQSETTAEHNLRVRDYALEGARNNDAITLGEPLQDGLLYTALLCHGPSGAPVGVCVFKTLGPDEVHHLRSNFEVDEVVNFVPSGVGDYSATNIDEGAPDKRFDASATMPAVLVTHFHVRAIFRSHIRFFLRDLLRQTKRQLIFHCLNLHDEVSAPLLAELILAMPRRMIDQTNLPITESPQDEEEELLTLHFSSHKQLSDEKTKIFSRLVVIGAGTTGLAALYAFLKIPYLHIPNLVLVSRDGIPDHPNVNDPECWTVDTLTWLEREYILFKVGNKVRIIEGTMIDFERNDKYIVTDNGFIEPYDHLIITAGRQYTVPREMLASSKIAKSGVFELSGSSQINKIKQHIRESEAYEDELSNAVIYGSTVDVYCVATSLTHIGLNPSRIVIVSPEDTDTEQTSIFGDPLIDIKVDKLMESLGAKTYKHHVLERMDYDEDQSLTSVFIVPQHDAQDGSGADPHKKKKSIEVPATMFIYCHEKDIDTQILSALNKRSIVFDGRVIVKQNYRTTDDFIYAVGPIAMFSGSFGPSDEFEMFNQLEVGQRFAETVLGFIGVEEFYSEEMHGDSNDRPAARDDPLAAELGTQAPAPVEEDKQKKPPRELPTYHSNVMRRVQLPSNFHSFQCRTARFHEIASKCTPLTSNNARGDNYLRISISPNKYIECISYFGSDDVEVHNLKILVGLPESVLNIVYVYEQSRNEKGEATLDLLAYLRSQWAYCLYYSKFPKLWSQLRTKVANHRMTERLRARVTQYVEQESAESVVGIQRTEFMQSVSGEDSDLRHMIELELIKFLHEDKHHFPNIYYLPDVSEFVPPQY